MAIHKIIWATDGSRDSLHALALAEMLAAKYNSALLGLSVIPLYYSVVDKFPAQEKDRFLEWMDKTLAAKEHESMKSLVKELEAKGIKFGFDVVKGIPHEEIIKYADTEKADFIALGRGRIADRFILGGTALKVIRGTGIPVLTAREGKTYEEFEKILVPIAISHGLSGNFDYALRMAEVFGGGVHVLNVVELGNLKVPLEIQEQLKGFALRDLVETIGATRISENTELHTQASGSGWRGIVEFSVTNDIDLVVMMTYGGRKVREEFIGSTTAKVIQESPCPVITLSP